MHHILSWFLIVFLVLGVITTAILVPLLVT